MNDKLMFYIDVDGVINALERPHNFQVDLVRCKDYSIAIPEYMPELIQGLAAIGEIRWLTTWRESANEWIAPLMGIDAQPVITDGTDDRYVGWKPDAALPQAIADEAAGYDIYWIEDFGRVPFHRIFDVVTPINTDAAGESVLLPQHLPQRVTDALYNVYDGPYFVPAPTCELTDPWDGMGVHEYMAAHS